MSVYLFDMEGEAIAFRRTWTDRYVFDLRGRWIGWFPWDDHDAVELDRRPLHCARHRSCRIRRSPRPSERPPPDHVAGCDQRRGERLAVRPGDAHQFGDRVLVHLVDRDRRDAHRGLGGVRRVGEDVDHLARGGRVRVGEVERLAVEAVGVGDVVDRAGDVVHGDDVERRARFGMMNLNRDASDDRVGDARLAEKPAEGPKARKGSGS